MSLVDSVNSAMAAAVAALQSGDFSTALQQAIAAQGFLALIPRTSHSAGVGGGAHAFEYSPQAIDEFVKNLRRQQSAALGVQSSPIVISEPAVLEDGEQFANSSGGYVQ
jgi:hypothetical protein